MAVLQQYHQYLFKVVEQEATQDANGNWQAPSDGYTIEYVGMCRYEVSGKGSVTNGSDGLAVTYNGIIYMRPTAWRAGEGQILIVSRDRLCNDEVYKGKMVSADYGRLHTRLWVE